MACWLILVVASGILLLSFNINGASMKSITNIHELCQFIVFSSSNDQLKKALEIKTDNCSFNRSGQALKADAFGADGAYQVQIKTYSAIRINCSCPHFVFRIHPAMKREQQVNPNVHIPKTCKHGLSVAIRFLQWSTKNE